MPGPGGLTPGGPGPVHPGTPQDADGPGLGGAGGDEADRLARRWAMPVEAAREWLAIAPSAWARANAATLHRAGMRADDARELHDRVDPAVRASIARLVDAGRMAALETAFLHRWAQAGLLQPTRSLSKRGRPQVSFTGWVTQARRFIAACAGDQDLAALCAAAGLTPAEAGQACAQGSPSRADLEAMAALRFALPGAGPR